MNRCNSISEKTITSLFGGRNFYNKKNQFISKAQTMVVSQKEVYFATIIDIISLTKTSFSFCTGFRTCDVSL